ncbi:cuticle protein 19-like [Aricia agestis]|uniref:cuticle protein 19-like n=1 Tax=Aricia agestis TaxID=91739 RepID=UPI001C20BF6B|nr:cuticle protein 19-like [Aricia agestis]
MDYIQIIGILSLLTISSCEPPSRYNSFAPSTSYLPPRQDYNNGYNYQQPHSGDQSQYDHHHNHHHENEVPKSYEFGYSVKDYKSGNDYDRRESSDGNVVRGEYRVQLPDGRTQIVTYHADWLTGYHADVRYEGEARYPEPANQGYNYNAPEFGGSLSGFQSLPSTSYGPPGYHK